MAGLKRCSREGCAHSLQKHDKVVAYRGSYSASRKVSTAQLGCQMCRCKGFVEAGAVTTAFEGPGQRAWLEPFPKPENIVVRLEGRAEPILIMDVDGLQTVLMSVVDVVERLDEDAMTAILRGPTASLGIALNRLKVAAHEARLRRGQ